MQSGYGRSDGLVRDGNFECGDVDLLRCGGHLDVDVGVHHRVIVWDRIGFRLGVEDGVMEGLHRKP